MEAVTILRELWRRRILVALAALASIFAAFAIAYTVTIPPESRKFEVGIATGRILVDTPDSQVVDVSPRGSGTLGIRAGLLANLMTEGEVKAAIARRAGLRPGQLHAGVEIEGELPVVLTSAAGKPNAYLLTTSPATSTDDLPLPMIDIETQAPDVAGAAQLANAAVAGLNDYLDTKAAGENVPDARRLQVTGFGAPQVRAETRGPKHVVALAAGLFLFICGCAAILSISALAGAWRTAAERDRTAAPPPTAGSRHRLLGGLRAGAARAKAWAMSALSALGRARAAAATLIRDSARRLGAIAERGLKGLRRGVTLAWRRVRAWARQLGTVSERRIEAERRRATGFAPTVEAAELSPRAVEDRATGADMGSPKPRPERANGRPVRVKGSRRSRRRKAAAEANRAAKAARAAKANQAPKPESKTAPRPKKAPQRNGAPSVSRGPTSNGTPKATPAPARNGGGEAERARHSSRPGSPR